MFKPFNSFKLFKPWEEYNDERVLSENVLNDLNLLNGLNGG